MSKGEWIDCKKRLPEEGTLCVVLSEHWSGHSAPPELAEREGSAATGCWRRFLSDDLDEDVPAYIETNVTYWMQLPEPPEVDSSR